MKTYVNINGQRLEATVYGRTHDTDWDSRESKTIQAAIEYSKAIELFKNDTPWSIVQEFDPVQQDDGSMITPDPKVYDNSEFSVSGPITDMRDGVVLIKMGKPTTEEINRILTGPETYRAISAKVAHDLRANIVKAAQSLDDKDASGSPELYDTMHYTGEAIQAGTKINWNGVVKKAAVTLWDREDQNPDNAPDLWADLDYKYGYRIIPDKITVTLAFAKDEYGWYKGKVYKSTVDSNVYTPDEYPRNWEFVMDMA